MKNLILILALFVGSSFAEDESSWKFYESEDPIDGNWSIVYSADTKSKGRLKFYNSGVMEIENGDSYICADGRGKYNKIKVILKIDDEEHFYQDFKLNKKHSSLFYFDRLINEFFEIERKDYVKQFAVKPKWGNSYKSALIVEKFVYKLKQSEKLFIRTNDGCGNRVDMNFNLSGFGKEIVRIYPLKEN